MLNSNKYDIAGRKHLPTAVRGLFSGELALALNLEKILNQGGVSEIPARTGKCWAGTKVLRSGAVRVMMIFPRISTSRTTHFDNDNRCYSGIFGTPLVDAYPVLNGSQ